MATWAQEFLQQADTPHVRQCSQKVGELSLAELARISPLEYGWEYDRGADVWRYAPPYSRHDVTIDGLEDGTIIGQGFVLNHTLLYPGGESSFFYHTHPQAIQNLGQQDPISKINSSIYLQLPSPEDIALSRFLTCMGYEGFHIITALGATSVAFNIERAITKNGHIWEEPEFSFLFDPHEIAEVRGRRGLVYAIDSLFDQLNTHFDGVFTFDFSNWNHVS